jgi:hypothetical protein
MKANYFKFGIFLVIAMALLVAAVVVLGAGVFEPRGEYFETYFDQSVSGLGPGAPVELQGVEIGQVESVGFASEVYDIPPDWAVALGEVRLVSHLLGAAAFREELTAAERQTRQPPEIGGGLRIRLSRI